MKGETIVLTFSLLPSSLVPLFSNYSSMADYDNCAFPSDIMLYMLTQASKLRIAFKELIATSNQIEYKLISLKNAYEWEDCANKI